MAETGSGAKTRSCCHWSDNGLPRLCCTQQWQNGHQDLAGGLLERRVGGSAKDSLGGLIERSRRESLAQLRARNVYLHSSDSHQSVSRCRCSSHGINASSSHSSRLAGLGRQRESEGQARQQNDMVEKTSNERCLERCLRWTPMDPANTSCLLEKLQNIQKVPLLLWIKTSSRYFIFTALAIINLFLLFAVTNLKRSLTVKF